MRNFIISKLPLKGPNVKQQGKFLLVKTPKPVRGNLAVATTSGQGGDDSASDMAVLPVRYIIGNIFQFSGQCE